MISAPPSLVERKKYDCKQAHQLAQGIWWVGFRDQRNGQVHNPYLLIDNEEAVLINPGSGADEHFKTVHDKVATLIDPSRIQHIVVGHHEPDRCGALPRFEKTANRHVRIYAPAQIAESITYYGCINPVIGLGGGDSIILNSGRTIDFHATPNLPLAGSGLLYDKQTETVFTGNIFGCSDGEWNLFALPNGWESMTSCVNEGWGSKKAHLHALNKLERLSIERICPQRGPIIEEFIDKYIEAARNLYPEK